MKPLCSSSERWLKTTFCEIPLPRTLVEHIMEYVFLTELIGAEVNVPMRLIEARITHKNFDERTLATILTQGSLVKLLKQYLFRIRFHGGS